MRLALSLLLCLLSMLGVAQSQPRWYGPATATFWVQFPGNPFDFETNDVHVIFVSKSGQKLVRPAYYDGGAWKANLVTPMLGRYNAILVRNGVQSQEPNEEGELELLVPMPDGFIRTDPDHTNRFRYDTGRRVWPVGFNLAWQTEGLISFDEQLKKMGEAGLDWVRIWASHWDSKNPWWPTADPDALANQLSPKALETWQEWIDACTANGLNFQMVLFHHGSFSTQVDANWEQHPWNKANGGFLEKPDAFFTDARAKKLTKMWLRYAVARWSHHSNLFAWELFNEVEWTEPAYNRDWKAAADWHSEMADYIRGLDPYRHLVTTSSYLAEPSLWEKMDFLQPHRHAKDVPTFVTGAAADAKKPLFLGEFGEREISDRRQFIRESLWASILANHAGAAQYWYWDLVEKENLYPLFKAFATVAREASLAEHPRARRISVFAGDSQVEALGEVDWFLGRIPAGASEVRSTGLAEGDYRLIFVSPVDGDIYRTTSTVQDFKLLFEKPLDSARFVIAIRNSS